MVLGFTGIIPVSIIGVLSMIFLVFGAEVVVSKMEAVAKYYGVSEVVIAVTIVSIGTSLPEIVIHWVGSTEIILSAGSPLKLLMIDPLTTLLGSHAEALNLMVQQGSIGTETANASKEVFRQTSGTVMGASIGSDVVQETLVMGFVIISSAFIAGKRGFRFSRKFLIRNYAPMMVTTLITLILALNWRSIALFFAGGSLDITGTITRLDGFVLVASFVLYMIYLYTTRKDEMAEQGEILPSSKPIRDLFLGLIAMIVVVGSAEVVLRVIGVAIQQTGLSGSMIGVATVGVVSAFPEMITAISGLRHGSEGISLGTLVGSNITNPLLALGGGALISSYAVPRPLVLWDLPMETFLAGIPVLYMFSKERLGHALAKPLRIVGWKKAADRMEAVENQVISITGAFLLIALYFVYLYVRFKYFPHDFIVS